MRRFERLQRFYEALKAVYGLTHWSKELKVIQQVNIDKVARIDDSIPSEVWKHGDQAFRDKFHELVLQYEENGIYIRYCTDEHLFNLRRLKALIKILNYHLPYSSTTFCRRCHLLCSHRSNPVALNILFCKGSRAFWARSKLEEDRSSLSSCTTG
ncbi:hypothetical protein LOAG_11080 [Loa loa]|uniref:Uncharacterized protein n=1 Tax=Loa loa TaxID=7209 RepID=A0A1S0TNK0_LOALO|nr:hypothetical protein LOAG_11080 [Loa loa]EFO17419.1 hypothetical protein LOAG_11080 [Loa loa]